MDHRTEWKIKKRLPQAIFMQLASSQYPGDTLRIPLILMRNRTRNVIAMAIAQTNDTTKHLILRVWLESVRWILTDEYCWCFVPIMNERKLNCSCNEVQHKVSNERGNTHNSPVLSLKWSKYSSRDLIYLETSWFNAADGLMMAKNRPFIRRSKNQPWIKWANERNYSWIRCKVSINVNHTRVNDIAVSLPKFRRYCRSVIKSSSFSQSSKLSDFSLRWRYSNHFIAERLMIGW